MREGHDPAHYNSEVALSDRHTSYAPHRKSYRVPHSDMFEPVRSSVEIRRRDWQLNPVVQREGSSPIQYRTARVRQGYDMVDDVTAYFAWNETEELDEFDLELLKTAKMGTIQKAPLSVADLRHPTQESSAWLSRRDQSADLAFRRSPQPIFFMTEDRHESPFRMRVGNQRDAEKRNSTPDKPTSQHQLDQAEFKPFRNIRSWFE